MNRSHYLIRHLLHTRTTQIHTLSAQLTHSHKHIPNLHIQQHNMMHPTHVKITLKFPPPAKSLPRSTWLSPYSHSPPLTGR
ncbi:hypothetical protein M426DRAFT_255336 [Hypoxylon sp. CI-4A]|nr:hypothetical protein M426DRAFT_255336 [Hypoxylon sp. CI-4A]